MDGTTYGNTLIWTPPKYPDRGSHVASSILLLCRGLAKVAEQGGLPSLLKQIPLDKWAY